MNQGSRSTWALLGIFALAGVQCITVPAAGQAVAVKPGAMPSIGSVDERFQSYNIEMVEVTGGRFWKPYSSKAASTETGGNQPAGLDPSLYEYRAPINLENSRLRKLAAALGPAYLRVSGTWANTTYFQDSDAPAPAHPPEGFKGVLTRKQWQGVIDFSNAVDAPLVTSFAISAGVRDANGLWTPVQAKQIVDYTKAHGGKIAAAELFNEPTMPTIGGGPKGYDGAAFGRDIAAFRQFAKESAPGMVVLGPGSVGEGTALTASSGMPGMMTTPQMLDATGDAFDAFSYHFYGAVSARCGRFGAAATTTPEAALTDEWLARAAKNEQFYAALRDKYAPGKTIWLTETAEAACGGDRWASTFLDTFRYLNQLGALSRLGVKVHMHNTLAASDYGLLDEKTYTPRPNYWAALLWHTFMGSVVLDPGASGSNGLHLYASCLRNHPGGVALLAINANKTDAQVLTLPSSAQRYTLTSPELQTTRVDLNGTELQLGANDSLPALKGAAARRGKLTLAPASITFLTFAGAHNSACTQ